MEKVRWGIVGPGWVAERFAAGVADTADGILEAVVSKTSLPKAQAFAAAHGVKKAYGSYGEFLKDPDIDIVYISILNPAHKQMVLDCLRAGKPAVCEKPFALNAGEAEEMIRTARQAKLFLMEAMWSRFLPIAGTVREWLAKDAIGEVQYVRADHGFLFENHNSRQYDRAVGGGAMMDLGVYAISFASMVLGCEPAEVQSMASIGDTGVDEQSVVLLRYPKGQVAILSCTMRVETPQEAWIAGTKGFIKIRMPFMNADRATLIMERKLTDAHSKIEEAVIPLDGPGYRYEAEEAMRCLRDGRLESPLLPLDETLGVMKIMDRVRRQWGLVYPGEA